MSRELHVDIELGDNVIEKLSAKEIAKWVETVVPALLKEETQEPQYLVAGIMSLMDTITGMTEFISSDSELLDSYIEFHGYTQNHEALH